ncbi:hypothetical protein E2I00_005855, partial [Balaenoptera physalus]
PRPLGWTGPPVVERRRGGWGGASGCGWGCGGRRLCLWEGSSHRITVSNPQPGQDSRLRHCRELQKWGPSCGPGRHGIKLPNQRFCGGQKMWEKPPPTATCRCRRDLSPPTRVVAAPAPVRTLTPPRLQRP